jgi:SAM-dependent methyltransferase
VPAVDFDNGDDGPRMPGTAYPPGLYEAVHTGNPGDVGFYVRACAGARRILELGGGCGRIGSALARTGAEVTLIDLNHAALRRAAAAGLAVVEADMRRFAFRARFDRIIAPFNTLYCLTSEEDLIACLEGVRRHLAPDGLLVFDGYSMDAWYEVGAEDEAGSDARPGFDVGACDPLPSVTVDGRRYAVFESATCNPGTQRADALYRHQPLDGGETVVVSLPQRYLRSAEIPDLLERAGLALRALHGSFDERPFRRTSEHLVVRAGRR